MTRVEILGILKIKSNRYFRNKFIHKALVAGLIELTEPDSPNSPTQKYRLTKKGKRLKNEEAVNM